MQQPSHLKGLTWRSGTLRLALQKVSRPWGGGSGWNWTRVKAGTRLGTRLQRHWWWGKDVAHVGSTPLDLSVLLAAGRPVRGK